MKSLNAHKANSLLITNIKNTLKNNLNQYQKKQFSSISNTKTADAQIKTIKPTLTKTIISNRNFKNNLETKLLQVKKDLLALQKLKQENEQNSSLKASITTKKQKQKKIFLLTFLFQKTKSLIKKLIRLTRFLAHIGTITVIIYLFYQLNFFNKLLNKFVSEVFSEFKKLIKQLYLGNTVELTNDILCDILEDPKFVAGVDSVIQKIYFHEYLRTNVKNVFWEAFSIFLKDMHSGSLLHTLLVSCLDDRLFEKVSREVFLNFVKSNDFQNQLEKILSDLTCDETFRAILNFLLKRNLLHYVHKPNFIDELRDFIKGFLARDYVFDRIFAYYYVNFNSKEQHDVFNEKKEVELLLGLRPAFDDQIYMKCARIDLSDKVLIDKFLSGKMDLLDLFKDKKFDFDPLLLNNGGNDEDYFKKYKHLFGTTQNDFVKF